MGLRSGRLVIASLAAAVAAALVVSPAIGGPSLKKLVKKEVRKQISKAVGPVGPAGTPGQQGVQGVQGAPGTAGLEFEKKTEPNVTIDADSNVEGDWQTFVEIDGADVPAGDYLIFARASLIDTAITPTNNGPVDCRLIRFNLLGPVFTTVLDESLVWVSDALDTDNAPDPDIRSSRYGNNVLFGHAAISDTRRVRLQCAAGTPGTINVIRSRIQMLQVENAIAL